MDSGGASTPLILTCRGIVKNIHMKYIAFYLILAFGPLSLFGQISLISSESPQRTDRSDRLVEKKIMDDIEPADAALLYEPVLTSVEQTQMGSSPSPDLVTSFDGLGYGFEGPQGSAFTRNPSDNSLAVGPNHIVQTVNSQMAIFDKKGNVLYGPVETKNVFKGFGGPCEKWNNGDAVVRYDQLADRWLIVMPIFTRLPMRDDEPETPTAADRSYLSVKGRVGQPGAAQKLYIPGDEDMLSDEERERLREERRNARRENEGSYCMCYAVSTSSDPFGSYYRYEFVRPLFPDYPRPAVWPDGYYVPTSTGDRVIEKHACVVDRNKMLKGEDATEQCFIIDDVSFLNNADLDGTQLPPAGAPNIMMATGGSQLNEDFDDDGIYYWKIYTDWDEPQQSRLEGPTKIEVAPYNFLCNGQLTECVPQPGTDQRLDAQGDKIMSRLIYRRIGDQESIVAVHSVDTEVGAGGVRWYEFRLDDNRDVLLYQQGTYAPDGMYRWMASPAMDKYGNIGIGYSYGGKNAFPGQRFAGRTPDDPPGVMTTAEVALVHGRDVQTNTRRWEDYTQTAIDPSDDSTIWYVGDYYQEGADTYSTRIGAFRLPGCGTE